MLDLATKDQHGKKPLPSGCQAEVDIISAEGLQILQALYLRSDIGRSVYVVDISFINSSATYKSLYRNNFVERSCKSAQVWLL